MQDIDEEIVALLAAVVIVFFLGTGFGVRLASGAKNEAITECERNLPRSQKCYAVIIAEPDTGEAKDG